MDLSKADTLIEPTLVNTSTLQGISSHDTTGFTLDQNTATQPLTLEDHSSLTTTPGKKDLDDTVLLCYLVFQTPTLTAILKLFSQTQ